jgi:endogenous inhibitor of DNA gyrase (YacG/DUF329 family)
MSPRAETCPLCKKPTDPLARPFCSQGCKDRDLLQWLDGGYAIPERAQDDERDSGLDSDGDAPL